MADGAPDADETMASERLGRVLGGKWKLERLLGVGGMAAVYAARGTNGEQAALKVLHPEMCRRTEIRKRFEQEGLAATRVGHPGAVAVLGSGEDPDGTAFLVLELLDGESLSDLLNRERSLPLARLLDLLDQVLDVLAAAHERGIVHRDLKPDNLFVTSDGRVKVLDFGIARVLDDLPGAYKTRTGITLGTVPFMSPEQALGKRAQVDGRSDLFSLGAMTFRIVAGRYVHSADTDAELLVAMASKPAPPIASVAPACPPALAAVVDLALAFAKDARYPDARTMQGDVRAVKDGKAPPYANRMRAARDMATRTDLPVPAISVVANRGGATVPEATAATRPDLAAATARDAAPDTAATTARGAAPDTAATTARGAAPDTAATTARGAAPDTAATTARGARRAPKAPASVQNAAPAPTIPEAPSFTVPDTAAPASLRGAKLPVPEARIAGAPTLEDPAFAAPTLPMAAAPDARTVASMPPGKRAAWVRPALVGGAALAVIAGGGYFLLSRGAAEGSAPATAPVDPSSAPVAPSPAVQVPSAIETSGAAPGPLPPFGGTAPSNPHAASRALAPTATNAPSPTPTSSSTAAPTAAITSQPGPTSVAPPPSPPAPTPTPAPTRASSPSAAKPQAPPAPAPEPTTPPPPPEPTAPKGWQHGHKHH